MNEAMSKKLELASSNKSKLTVNGENPVPGTEMLPPDPETNAYSKSASAMAFLNNRRLVHLIPKDREAWLQLLCNLVLRKTSIQYLTDKELKKVIIRARPNLGGPRTPYKRDIDAPLCIDWNNRQVLEWLKQAGFPHLVETFKVNQITGVRLISVDCSALNQMGLKNLDEMRAVTSAIRELLSIPQPNGVRALMRIPAYESYLKKRIKTGKTYDLLTFAKYCKEQGFTYAFLRTNKNGNIPCTCEVRIVPAGITDEEDDDGEESDDGERSLLNAPSVEFTVRNLILRDKTVNALIEAIMESVFCEDPEQRQYGRPLKKAFEEELDIVTNGMSQEERLAFTAEVVEALMAELVRTAEILRDIEELKKHIKEDVTPERVQELRVCADIVLETVMPIAGLVALGDLTLESIFRSDPELEQLVEDVVAEAEEATNSLVPEALAFVDSVIKLAMERLDEMDIPYLTGSELQQAKEMAKETLDLSNEYVGFGNDTGMGVQTEKKSLENDDKDLIEFFRSGIFPQSPPETDGEEGDDEDEGDEEEGGDKPKLSTGSEGHNVQTVGAVHTIGKPRGTLTLHSSDASTIARSATPTTPPMSAGSQQPPGSRGNKSDAADETGDATGNFLGKKKQSGGGSTGTGEGKLSLKEAGQLAIPPGQIETGGKITRIKLNQRKQYEQQPPEESSDQGQRTNSNPPKKIVRESAGTTDLQQQSQAHHSEEIENATIMKRSTQADDESNAQNRQQQEQTRNSNAQPTIPGGDKHRSGIAAPPTTPHQAPQQKEQPSNKTPVAQPIPNQAAVTSNAGDSQGQQQQRHQPHPQQQPTIIPQIIEPQDTIGQGTKNLSQQQIAKQKRNSSGGETVDERSGLKRDPSNLHVNKNNARNAPNIHEKWAPNAGAGHLQVKQTPSTIGLKVAPSSDKINKVDESTAYGEKAFEFFLGGRKDPAFIEASQRKAEQVRLAERKEVVAEKTKQAEAEDKTDISKKIWNDLQKQNAAAAASQVHGGDDAMMEKNLINAEAKKLEATKGGIVTGVTNEVTSSSKEAERHSFGHQPNNKGPKQELRQIRNALVKRRQIAEEWAKEKEAPNSNMSEQEEARLLRITADGIVSDILQMALTNMLLQAEAGKDTERIMNALKRIKTPAQEKVHNEHDVILWEPHLPGAGGPKKGGLKKETTSTPKKKVSVQDVKKPNKKDDDEREVTRL